MAYEEAGRLYAAAAQIVQNEATVTPGERAVVYACLASVEAALATAELLVRQQENPDGDVRDEIIRANGHAEEAFRVLEQGILGHDSP
jgi:hypothetical protein